MHKKGDFGFEQIAKMLIAVAVLLLLIILMYLFRDKMDSLLENLLNLIRFK